MILAVGIVVVGFWFVYRAPVAESLPTPICAGPPNYEPSYGPCSGTDFSALAGLPITKYCDLVHDPSNRDNQIVRVRGIYSYGMENSALDDPACRSDDAWTWVEAAPYSNFMHSVATLKRNQPAEVVFLGKFSGPNKEGYGHLNGSRYQLIVMNVEEMKPLAAAR